jgi:hypothetical protein
VARIRARERPPVQKHPVASAAAEHELLAAPVDAHVEQGGSTERRLEELAAARVDGDPPMASAEVCDHDATATAPGD